ncbi:MAG TPA: CvpA family protein [Roseiflexaceae bacterium]|nr:CvpA family protein [Roseiflexaceae bacterium]
MALQIVFGMAVALMALLGFVGFRRDLRRAVLALAGTLLGATMAGFWAAPWSQSLASRFADGTSPRLLFAVSSLIFLICALVVGYGGGSLLGPQERGHVPRRIAGALLGVLNGALWAAYLLRFASADDAGVREVIQSWLPTRVLHDGLPLLFLLVTAVLALLIIVRALIAFAGRDRAPKTASAAVTPAAPIAPSRVDDKDVLKKVNDVAQKT